MFVWNVMRSRSGKIRISSVELSWSHWSDPWHFAQSQRTDRRWPLRDARSHGIKLRWIRDESALPEESRAIFHEMDREGVLGLYRAYVLMHLLLYWNDEWKIAFQSKRCLDEHSWSNFLAFSTASREVYGVGLPTIFTVVVMQSVRLLNEGWTCLRGTCWSPRTTRQEAVLENQRIETTNQQLSFRILAIRMPLFCITFSSIAPQKGALPTDLSIFLQLTK